MLLQTLQFVRCEITKTFSTATGLIASYRNVPTLFQRITKLHQLRELSLGSDQDRNVRVGVFPEGKKLIEPGGGFVLLAASQVQLRQVNPGGDPVLLRFPSEWRVLHFKKGFIPANRLLGIAGQLIRAGEAREREGAALFPIGQQEKLDGMVLVAPREFNLAFEQMHVAGLDGIVQVGQRLDGFQDLRGFGDGAVASVRSSEPQASSDFILEGREERESLIELAEL